MSTDLKTQLRSYFKDFDASLPTIAPDDAIRAQRLVPAVRRVRFGWAIALAAAVVVLVVVGGAALLMRPSADQQPVVTDPPQPTTPVPAGSASLSTVDGAGDTGRRLAAGVGPDGLPIVAFVDGSSPPQIRLARCLDAGCTQAESIVMSQLGVGEDGRPREVEDLDLATTPDGRVAVAFADFDHSTSPPDAPMKVVTCDLGACSEPSVVVIGQGQHPTIALHPDGRPVVVFSRLEGGDAVLVACSEPTCSGPRVETILEPQVYPRGGTWIGPDDLPRVAYVRGAAENPSVLIVARCRDADCTPGAELLEVAELGPEGNNLQVATDSAGRPAVLFGFEAPLTLFRCLDADCAGFNRIDLVDVINDEPEAFAIGASLAFDSADAPMVTLGEGEVRVVRCIDSECAGGVVWSGLGVEADWTSLALPRDGLPVIALYANRDLKLLRCGDPQCSVGVPPLPATPEGVWQQVVVGPGDVTNVEQSPSLLIGPDGMPVLAYTSQSGPVVVRCADAECSQPVAIALGGGMGHALTLTEGGTPVVATGRDYETVELIVCGDAACNAVEHITIAEGVFVLGPVMVAMDPQGLPVVTYQDLNDFHIYLARCADEACGATTITKLEALADDDDMRWFANSVPVVVTGGDRPLVAISSAFGGGELQLVRCADAACDGDEVFVVDGETLGDFDTSTMVIGPGGNPVLAWYADGVARLGICADDSCREIAISDLGPSIADFIGSQTPSVAFRSDGSPLIAYRLPGQEGIAIAVCSDAACSDHSVARHERIGSFALAVGPDDLPYLAGYRKSDSSAAVPDEVQRAFELAAIDAEESIAAGAFDDASRDALAEELGSIFEQLSGDIGENLFEIIGGIRAEAISVEEGLGRMFEVLDSGMNPPTNLVLSRCVDPACLSP
jgi:hypothetical protein